MQTITIPCEIYARMSKVLKLLPPEAGDWGNTIRLDGNCAVASNRSMLAVQKLDITLDQPVHIKVDPELVAICEKEAQYNSTMQFIVVPAAAMITCKTMMGYQHTANLFVSSTDDNYLENWRSVIPEEPAKKSDGGLLLELTNIQTLVETSPSKIVTLPTHINRSVAVVIRDLYDDSWFGVFLPFESRMPHDPAKLPGWFK